MRRYTLKQAKKIVEGYYSLPNARERMIFAHDNGVTVKQIEAMVKTLQHYGVPVTRRYVRAEKMMSVDERYYLEVQLAVADMDAASEW